MSLLGDCLLMFRVTNKPHAMSFTGQVLAYGLTSHK